MSGTNNQDELAAELERLLNAPPTPGWQPPTREQIDEIWRDAHRRGQEVGMWLRARRPVHDGQRYG